MGFRKIMISMGVAVAITIGSVSIGSVDAPFIMEAKAATQQSGDYTYELDGKGEATLTSYTGSETGGITIPETLDGHSVVAIGDNLFNNQSGLTGRVIIPDSVKTIGSNAFSGCVGLTGTLELSSNLTTIGTSAFQGCTGITAITMPDSIVLIDGMAFYGCTGLEYELQLPTNLEYLGACAFQNCSGLTGDLVIPDSLISIDNFAFAGCVGLSGDVIFPTGTETLNAGVFKDCTGLNGNVVIPNTVVDIISGVFAGCTNLNEVTVPASVESIGYRAFANMARDTEITILNPDCEISVNVPIFDDEDVYKLSGYSGSTTEDYYNELVLNGHGSNITYSNIKTEAEIKEELVRSFVDRMYTIVLGRDAEAEGENAWTAALLNKQVTGAQLVKAFIEGDEFIAKNLSNTEYMNVVYKAVMDRQADNDGMQVWLGCMESGMSRTFVLNGFMGSEEFTNICNSFGIEKGSIELVENRDKNYGVTCFVQRFYTKTLERAAEVDGLNTWTGAILEKKITPAEAARIFVFSDEANALGRDNTAYIYMMYRTFMGRECEDQASLDVWLGYLEGHSREEMFDLFANSNEFKAIVAGYGL